MLKFFFILPFVAWFAFPVSAADLTSDISLLQKKADKGDAAAQFDLGLRYAMGRGTGIDYVKATEWFEKSAAQDYVPAEFNLGVSYDLGRGVTQDYTQALKWYKKAAAKGFAQAENNIGDLYEHGQGVKQDYAEAARWYKQAVDQNNHVAQSSLGLLYYAGNGVAKDCGEAYFWLSLGMQDLSENEDNEIAAIKHAHADCQKQLNKDKLAEIDKRIVAKAPAKMLRSPFHSSVKH